jgi:hypothetical protein
VILIVPFALGVYATVSAVVVFATAAVGTLNHPVFTTPPSSTSYSVVALKVSFTLKLKLTATFVGLGLVLLFTLNKLNTGGVVS